MDSKAVHPEARPLKGISVLVTRPASQAESICTLIRQYGGEAIAFPVIDITTPNDSSELLKVLKQLNDTDLMIFVSAHAVQSVATLLAQNKLTIPAGVSVAAVGPKTAAQCEHASIKVDFVPDDQINSEGLLDEMSDFDVGGKNILIFRGQSGRELIKEVLQARGATVQNVESYQRKINDQPVEPLLKRWRGNGIDLVMVTSVAVLDALRDLIGVDNEALLEETAILTYSHRVAEYCREVGILAEILVVKKPTDEAIIDSIIEWVTD